MNLFDSHHGPRLSLRAPTLAFIGAILLQGCATPSKNSPPPPLKIVAPADLAAPETLEDRTYLGLSSDVSRFTFLDLAGDLVLVDLFDMYCHSCHTAARHVLELYHEVQKRGLGNRIKFVGLGVGDTPMETTLYREKFALPFPVFPDRDAAIAKSLGPLKVPSLIVLRRVNGRLEVIHRTDGVPRQTEELLEHILSDEGDHAPVDENDALHRNASICNDEKAECAAPERSAATPLDVNGLKIP